MRMFVPFTKSDDEERMVYGYASTEALDSQGEVVAKTAIEEALPDYMKFANIREMHTTSAVGKAHEAIVDEKGLWLGVKVVDDNAWQKVKEGVYNGFSIGGKIITKINDTITKLRLTEISLVDRPANPEAVFAFYKGDGMDEENQAPEPDTVVDENATAETETAKSDEVNKADQALQVLKGYVGEEVWDAQIALTALDNIMYLLRNESYEEEDMPEQIKALQDAVKAIKQFIVSEIQEDNGSGESAAGAIVELSDQTGDLEKGDGVGEDIAKAGAAISAANKTKLSQIMSICKELMGEEEEAEKADTETDLTKGEEIAKAYDMVKSELDLAKGEIAKRDARIAELEALPQVPKGAVNGFAKSADYGQGEKEAAVIVKSADGSVNDVASMIKAIHSGRIS